MKSSTAKYCVLSERGMANSQQQTEYYTFNWKNVDLQGSLVAGASSGGAIGSPQLTLAF